MDWEEVFYDLVDIHHFELSEGGYKLFLNSGVNLILEYWVRLKQNQIDKFDATTIAVAKLSLMVGGMFAGEKNELSIDDFLPQSKKSDNLVISLDTCRVFWEYLDAHPDLPEHIFKIFTNPTVFNQLLQGKNEK